MTNGILNLFCALQSLILILSFLFSKGKTRPKSEITFFYIMIAVFVMLATDGAAMVWLTQYPLVFDVIETLSVVAMFVLIALLAAYVVQVVRPKDAVRIALMTVVCLVSAGGSAMYLVNFIHPFFYNISQMTYTDEWIHLGIQIAAFVAGVFIVIVVLVNGRNKIRFKDYLFIKYQMVIRQL